jgi:Winged helix DNA-binding domain
MVRPPLAKAKFAGNTYWLAGSVPAAVRSFGEAYLLPYVDEYTVAYKDCSALADPELMIRISAASPVGILGPIIVMNGRIVGIWKRTMEKKKLVISINLFSPRPRKLLPPPQSAMAASLGCPLLWRYN